MTGLFVAVGLLLLLGGCDRGAPAGSGDLPERGALASGAVQKGPFAPGATARVAAFDLDGPAVSESVSVPVDANGRYSFAYETLPQAGRADAYELRVTGRFFDETTGQMSSGTRSLRGLFKFQPPGNVNIFTHILASRIQVLMAPRAGPGDGQGLGFEAARTQATLELQKIFGLSASPGELDVLTGAEHAKDSANLLLLSAASLAANGGQRALDAIASDFGNDGQINGTGLAPMQAIARAARDNSALDERARDNLASKYHITPPAMSDEPPPWVAAFAGGDDSDGVDPAAIGRNTITGRVNGKRMTRTGGIYLGDREPGGDFVAQAAFGGVFSDWMIAFPLASHGQLPCGSVEHSDVLISVTPPVKDRENPTRGDNYVSSLVPLGQCRFTVTRNDGAGGQAQGTFSGTLANEAGGTVEVSDGAFNIDIPAF